MHKRKLVGGISVAAVLCSALVGCGEKNPEREVPPTPVPGYETIDLTVTPEAPVPTMVPYRDLGGLEVIIGTHWEDYGIMIPEWQPDPVKVYRDELMETYNFKIDKVLVAGWGEMQQEYVNSVLEGTPSAQIFELDYRFVSTPMTAGLFYDLATLKELDFSEEKWNDSVRELMTAGDRIYGMKAGVSEPRAGVIFNKRLFEEAGLDPNLPYDLQASGEWTWSKFEELCKTLTRDTDGDGETDVYATVSQGTATLQTLVASAGSDFVRKDKEGMLYNNLQSEEVTKAMNFAVDLYQKGYEMPQPEDSDWDYFIPAFREGKAAMQFSEVYRCSPGNDYGDCMEDDVGFVMPPKPHEAADYCSYAYDNIMVIPSCYDEETASNIAYAYNLYTSKLMAEEGGEGWQEQYYSYFSYDKIVDGKVRYFDDERAVEETLSYFTDASKVKQLNSIVVYGLGDVMGEDLFWMYPFETITPEEQIKLISEEWNALIAETNKSR